MLSDGNLSRNASAVGTFDNGVITFGWSDNLEINIGEPDDKELVVLDNFIGYIKQQAVLCKINFVI